MEIKFNKNSKEWAMFRDFWILYQKYYKPEAAESYWKELVNAVGEFNRKYNTKFSAELSCSLFNDIERRYKGDKE